MKTYLNYILIFTATIILWSCDDVEPALVDYRITLSAGINDMNSSRSTNGVVFNGTSAHNMTATVLFSNVPGEFQKHDVDNLASSAPTYLPYHATVTYSDDTPVAIYPFNDNQRVLSYPISQENPVYCVGLYPASEGDGNSNRWIFSEDYKKAVHNIDGKKDIMFASQVSGTWATPIPKQTYRHLLSWLIIEATVTDSEAFKSWGKIKRISITNPNNQVEITLGDGTVEFSNNSNQENQIDAFNKTNTESEWLDLGMTVNNIGSLLLAPAKEYEITVVTEKVTRTVIVPLLDNNGEKLIDNNYKEKTMGKLFLITLYFNSFVDIDASCSLVPWNEQNEELRPVKPETN